MSEQKSDELKFEEAMVRLEEIVRLLEQGEATLDEALALFEEGVKLARFCNDNSATISSMRPKRKSRLW